MPETKHAKILRKYRRRNKKIIEAYLRGVSKVAAGKSAGMDAPVKIRKRFGLNESRIYQILRKHNITASYKKFKMRNP